MGRKYLFFVAVVTCKLPNNQPLTHQAAELVGG
jgi:hypothetical protein